MNKNYWFDIKEGKLYREDESKRTLVDSHGEIDMVCKALQASKPKPIEYYHSEGKV